MSSSSNGGDESEHPSTPQKAVMVASVLLVVALTAFVGWQLVSAPSGNPVPTANVTSVSEIDAGVAATVTLDNPRSSGFRVVTVEVDCASPPTEVSFEFVPGQATRQGTVTCPANATSPTATVVSWVEA